MAMFQAGKGEARPASPRGGSQEPRLSIIAAGTKITGELETDGMLRIEGHVEGNLRVSGQLLVAKGGVVSGDVATRQVIVGGEVQGQILADEWVELQPGCSVTGDITTPRIAVQEGGVVNGRLKMAKPHAMEQTPKSMEQKAKYPAGAREKSDAPVPLRSVG